MDTLWQTLWMYGLVGIVSFAAAAVIFVIDRAVTRPRRRRAVPPPAAIAPVVADGIPPEHLAVIAAAAWAMVGEHRIVHIADSGRGVAWTTAGRINHLSSHNIRSTRNR